MQLIALALLAAFTDPVTGVSLHIDDGWQVMPDPVLFEESYGFAVYAQIEDGEHEREAIARVALVHHARPVEELVAEKMAQYAELAPQRRVVTIGKRNKGVLVTGLPGTSPYSVAYTRVGDRVYEVGMWHGPAILERLRFTTPTQTVASLDLAPAADAAYDQPPPAVAMRNAIAASKRRDAVRAALAQEGALTDGLDDDGLADPLQEGAPEAGAEGAPQRAVPLAASCGFTAPASLSWQLQWDSSNTFYSGTYYDLQTQDGFSAMSGNYGSWWGTNYHVGLCYTTRSNQYYANDWPAQHWANAYAAFPGTVEWAGWGTDGFYTLGRYVVVRTDSYRNVTAHLSGIAPGIAWGARVDAYWDVIGWAGNTGGPWDPHLHARVSWGESLTWNGQPYAGQAVRPLRLRCFECTNNDVTNNNGSRFYNSFWHGRWMRF